MQYINIPFIIMWCLVIYLNYKGLLHHSSRTYKIAGVMFIGFAIFFIVFDTLRLFELV